MPGARLVLVLTIALAAEACGSETQVTREPTDPTSPSPSTESPEPSSPSRPGGLADARVELEQIVSLDQPVALAVRTGDPNLYFAEKTGRVVVLREGQVRAGVVVDITDEVSQGGEQGLLGLAFSPEGDFLYINYTDTAGHTHVTEFAFGEDGPDEGSRRDVLFVEQPFSNHNGGNLVFGPDGFLYIGLGDGGSAGDPLGNAQSLTTLLGKMLRISPRPSGNAPYGVPRDNPFVDRSDARPEIWAYGLRNPWRYSFDRETDDLWIGDVGQGSREEIDLEPAGSSGGRNFGWDLLEGTLAFEGAEPPDDATPPTFEYPTSEGCAVTGGYVYRGDDIPELTGAYVFGDFCNGQIQAFQERNGRAVGHRELGLTVENLASFGEDADGELYALSLSGPVFRLVPA